MAHGDPVIVAHDPLDEGQTGAHTVSFQQMAGLVLPQEKQIQVAAFGPDDLTVKHGVDVIRAALEGHRLQMPVHQRLKDGAGNGGFSTPAGRGAQQQPGGAHTRPSPEKIHTGFWASIR